MERTRTNRWDHTIYILKDEADDLPRVWPPVAVVKKGREIEWKNMTEDSVTLRDFNRDAFNKDTVVVPGREAQQTRRDQTNTATKEGAYRYKGVTGLSDPWIIVEL